MKTIDDNDFLRVIYKMTEISEEAKRIAKDISIESEHLIPDNIPEPFLKSYIKVKNSYEMSIQALMSKDVSMANSVLDEVAKIDFDYLWKHLIEEIKISASTFAYFHRVLGRLQQIQICVLNIAEIAIDLAEYY